MLPVLDKWDGWKVPKPVVRVQPQMQHATHECKATQLSIVTHPVTHTSLINWCNVSIGALSLLDSYSSGTWPGPHSPFASGTGSRGVHRLHFFTCYLQWWKFTEPEIWNAGCWYRSHSNHLEYMPGFFWDVRVSRICPEIPALQLDSASGQVQSCWNGTQAVRPLENPFATCMCQHLLRMSFL